ncbi:MAG TPA: hypothetical protein VJS38_20160, partial [Phenylobacterium sp.]|uniref:hypothetical protein n=1 Tax=Phenylobacterium sp. TaxID=1871053 RepID=UPI002B4A1C69
MTTAAGLWLTVIASGVFHGLNPAMGWPLAVAGMLAPFGLLTALLPWARALRIGAALMVIAAGLWLLLRPRHPRF